MSSSNQPWPDGTPASGCRGNSDLKSKSTQLPSIGGLQACLAHKRPRGGLEMLAMVSSLVTCVVTVFYYSDSLDLLLCERSLWIPPGRCASHKWLLPWIYCSLCSQSSAVGLWWLHRAKLWWFFLLPGRVWAVICMLGREKHKGGRNDPGGGQGRLCVSHRCWSKIGQTYSRPFWQCWENCCW